MSFLRLGTRILLPRRKIQRVLPRFGSTLPNNDQIYLFKNSDGTTTLSLRPTEDSLSLGTCSSTTPTIQNFQDNPCFLPLLHRVVAANAAADPIVQHDAIAFASQSSVSIERAFNRPERKKKQETPGGWLHVADQRATPMWGRIPEPEDIFGSMMVDGKGQVVDGSYEPNRTYRLVAGDKGAMRLSDYLHEKVVEALKGAER